MVSEETNGSTEMLNPAISKDKKSEPDNKDRTLFCINIDPRTTEDILYELFLQAGPIENIIRKEDRNGNLICLIIYKHVEACEYAINLFNGINLYNMSLKVQLSQQPGNQGSQNRRSINNYANLNNNGGMSRMSRHLSVDTPGISRMRHPQSLMAQQFQSTSESLHEFGTPKQSFQNPYSDFINQSMGSNLNFENNNQQDNHQSRRNGNYNNNRGNNRGHSNDYRRNNSHNNYDNRNHNNNVNYHQNQYQRNGSIDHRRQSRDERCNNNNNYNNDRSRDRSRSPLRKKNRF